MAVTVQNAGLDNVTYWFPKNIVDSSNNEELKVINDLHIGYYEEADYGTDDAWDGTGSGVDVATTLPGSPSGGRWFIRKNTNGSQNTGVRMYIYDTDQAVWVFHNFADDPTGTRYADNEAIAAVEGEATLALTGTLSLLDNTFLILGGNNDFRLRHDGGSINFIDSGSHNLRIINVANWRNFLSGVVEFRDSDDSDVVLWQLNTSAGSRTLIVGAAADLVDTTFNGTVKITGNVGFHNTAPVAQSAAYTRNATIVEDRTLLASASATAINNNNVLAALIADLQANGLLG